MNPGLTLNLQAASAMTEIVAGWEVESYALSGTARGPEQPTQKVALAPGEVLRDAEVLKRRLADARDHKDVAVGQA